MLELGLYLCSYYFIDVFKKGIITVENVSAGCREFDQP